MAFWLLKSDPGTYSFDDLLADRTTTWDGIRNHQARLHLLAMKAGDSLLMYHSGSDPAVVGTATVIRAAYPDPRADDPRWVNVDIRAGKKLKGPVTLAAIREDAVLKGMAILRQSRLSVAPVTPAEWKAVHRLAGA
jgi:predicted RNA-binding protein with PUA-like domain